ncbi:Lipopolysaccharide export system permease protein LptG [Candidatus Gullanella endobia]|uniref:Lipopolysaccharide export system permease protein LptG n=1 Tax=Candidatus Gullanella endobia TaxID=1070130 RepID=A0A143WRU5_9ENTR|nr:LPS export ABC transporter permease LptG [Candidatus Gullanella endobia]CUX96247.1 Lipopolysaccharide export system permease protein LptG [Candidatus Gullanella endobia]
MFYVLDRYIGKIIFNDIMMTLFILISLSGIIKFIEQLRKVGQGSYSIVSAGLFTLLRVPGDIEIFFPMAALLGTLLGLGSLATHSELVVIQASGFKYMQIAGSVMKTAIPLILLTMIIGEWVVPKSEKIACNYRIQMIYGNSILLTKNGLWAKDGNDFIFIEQVAGNGDKLIGINIYHFDQADRLKALCYSTIAKYKNGIWKLSQIDKLDLTNDKQISSQKILNSEWRTNLTPDKLRVVTLDPNSLSILGLHNYINYLKHNGQDYKRYQLNMWSKIFSPFSMAVMILMALSFIFGPLRSVTMGVRVVIGISFGFLFYVLDQIFRLLSLVYDIPPVFGALLPNIGFFIISIIVLLQRQ